MCRKPPVSLRSANREPHIFGRKVANKYRKCHSPPTLCSLHCPAASVFIPFEPCSVALPPLLISAIRLLLLCSRPHFSVKACLNALQTAFEKVDAEVNRISHWSYQGSTAVAVMIHEGTVDEDNLLHRTLISANVGDSLAILCKRDGSVVQLTRDHKPNDVMERHRIEASGGSVDWCGMSDDDGSPIEGTGVYRINGNLAVARAIGDRAEKPSEVEISTYDISGDRTGDIILLVSDGLWDVMENEDVADFVRRKLQEVVVDAPGAFDEGESVALEAKQLRMQWKRVAELVVDEALQRGSTDNVSVVIIMVG